MPDIAPDVARWIESVTNVRIERTERLVGGMSSDVHRCWCEDGSTFVVRHISNREWLAREPDLITQESLALELLVESDVAAPRHVASDARAGLLLMTFLPGAVLKGANELRPRSGALADLANRIATVDLPDDHGLNPWRSWAPLDPQPPDRGEGKLWQEAIAA